MIRAYRRARKTGPGNVLEKGIDMRGVEDKVAISTSAAGGSRFDKAGRYHHLFDPPTAGSARHHGCVAVIAGTATVADALSTGLSAMAPEAARRLVHSPPDVRALFSPPSNMAG